MPEQQLSTPSRNGMHRFMGLFNASTFPHAQQGTAQTSSKRRHARYGKRRGTDTSNSALRRLGYVSARHVEHAGSGKATLHPPAPPITLTALTACDPATGMEILWHIAHHVPELRRWLVANPNATPELMEYIAQAGGPGVNEAIEILLFSIERQPSPTDKDHRQPSARCHS